MGRELEPQDASRTTLIAAARLGWDLIGFLRERWTPEQCMALVRRVHNFLDNLERLVYGHARSP